MRTGARWLLALYLVLLIASHAVRRAKPWRPGPSEGQQAVQLLAVDGDRESSRRITLVYRDLGPEPPRGSADVPVVLLHGSPGSFQDFAALGQRLSRMRRVLIPDLPGFGRSDHRLPDYSIRADAHYVRAWLDSLGVGSAHVVGFSMGGGVALHLANDIPGRVASVAMIGSIGVQELELLGNYELNHLLHRVQLGFVWLLHEAVPHFGRLDGVPFDVAFARNFTDTDQRPLRGLLEALQQPLLIVHGVNDPLVPYAAAREHRRIVPQSDLVTFENGSHFLLWTEPGAVAGHLDAFFDRVEAGTAPGRNRATPERLAAAAVPFSETDVPPASGMQVLVLVALIVLGTLLTEDLTCIATGLLIAQGRLDAATGVLACFLGIYVGDLGLYLAGRLAGPGLFRRRPWRWFIREGAVRAAAKWFDRRGMWVVVLTRFIPGSRVPAYVAAGLVRASFVRFALWFFVAVALWTPALVGLSALAGRGSLPWPALLLVAAALWLGVQIGIPMLTRDGRRVLRVRWRRLFAWEFWPLWLFYLPVLAWIAGLVVRYRSLSLVSAVNPGMPEGGFVGESKGDILRTLAAAGDRVARTRLLPAGAPSGERVRRVHDFLEESGLGFPVVVKPDTGERGRGVSVVHSARELPAALERIPGDALVQELVGGPEFGLFYVRHPADEKGSLFSITEKVLPEVVGDGLSTLRELILADDRAVMIAETYFEANADRLGEVPAPEERVRLVEIGTHSRGAIFLDGAHARTAELEAAVDRVSRMVPGFFFGRYDVRAPSVEALRAGEFRVLELNGMTSEATHVYDPRHSLRSAYAALFRQWDLAFEIAAANRARGARPATVGEMLRRLRDYRRVCSEESGTPSPPKTRSWSAS